MRPIATPPISYEETLIGTVLGSYKVLELLGKGGMGCVFRAKHMKLDRDVALKLLRSDYSRHRDVIARFFQEARTVNRVRHRNIVDVTDLVELPDGTTFIVMELLRGQRFGEWARRGIDFARAISVLAQICEGLGAAHQVGVVHRDLKPDNIIIVPSSDGTELVKLLDFGVAKLLHREGDDVGFETAAGTVVGTPAYMSPEQAGGMPVDPRSDIYSLGAIMYRLFCGQHAFIARSFGEYIRKHLNELPLPPRATPGGAQIDPRLEFVILKCLEKAPEHRFQTVFELRNALLALRGENAHVPALGSDAHHLNHSSPGTASASLRIDDVRTVPPRGRPRRWLPWLVIGTLATAAGASTAAWYALRTRSVLAGVKAPTVPLPPEPPPIAPTPTAPKSESVVTPVEEPSEEQPIDMSPTQPSTRSAAEPVRRRPSARPPTRAHVPEPTTSAPAAGEIKPTDILEVFPNKPEKAEKPAKAEKKP